MTFPIRACPFLLVTIGGVPMPLAWVDAATDGIAPEVGSAEIRIPLGKRLVAGEIVTADPPVGMRAAVTIVASDSSYAWYGEVVRIREASENGGRWLTVTCQGDAAALERCYLSTFRQLDYGSGAPFQSYGGHDLNANRNQDASAATFTVAGVAIHVIDTYGLGRIMWNQTTACAAILAIATADAGLPVYTLDDPSTLLTKENTWQAAGKSVHSSLADIIGQRFDATWRCIRSGTDRLIAVRPAFGGGTAIDLTSPFCVYACERDGTTTLKAARSVGSRKQFVLTLLHYPASSGSDLEKDWLSSDEDSYYAGNLDSPAFRRFKIATGLALPDGSTAANGELMGGIPCLIDADSGTVLGGPGYSQQAVIMWHDVDLDIWTSLSGKVSITRRGDAAGVWIDGAEWVQIYQFADRVAFTVCIEACLNNQVEVTGGEGDQWGFVAVPGEVCEMLTGTYLGVSDGGTVVTYGGGIFRNDTTRQQEFLDAWKDWNLFDGLALSWTDAGVYQTAGLQPGDVVASALLWDGDGTTTKTQAVDYPVMRRTVRWTEQGGSVQYTTGKLPPDLNAIVGRA